MGGDARNRGQRDAGVLHQRVGLQPLMQRGEIDDRLDRGAGLAQRLGGAVELAGRIGEAAHHRQDAAGLVLQHHGSALNLGPHAQLGAAVVSRLAVGDADIDDVVELQLVDLDAFGRRQRHGSAVLEADADRQHAPFVGPLFDHDRRRPLHVVERQPRILQRYLPHRPGPAAALRLGAQIGVDAMHRLAEVDLRTGEFDALCLRLVARETFLQGCLGSALQLEIDGRLHRI